MKKIIILLCAVSVFLTACSIEKEDAKKLRDIDFTVMDEESVPEELKVILEEKKQSEFKVTYEDGKYLYIATGYGEQKNGGYSIAVNELFLTSNAIYFDTNLIGPSKEEKPVEVSSFPYIVVKIQYMEKPVVFK